MSGCGSPGKPSLQISVASAAMTLYPDNVSTQTVQTTVSSVNQAGLSVSVSVTGLPDGVTVTPTVLSLASGATGTLTFKASTTAGAALFAAQGGTTVTVPLTIQATTGPASASTGVALTLTLANPNFVPTVTDLPVMQITTDGGAPIANTTDYVTGSVSIVPGTAAADKPYTGTMQIRGHGNTTWLMPKKPYKLKLDSKAPLLGMASGKTWVLLANYDDKSLLRNLAALETGRRVGMAWTSNSRYVELFLNGQYEGNYQLTEEIKIDKNRVNITEMDPTDVSGDAVTGGYLLEADTSNQPDDILFNIAGIIFDLHDPDPAAPEQLSYIQNYLGQTNTVLYSDSFTDPVDGYTQYLDSESFIDWYLVNELFKNNDAIFWSSCWMYKDRGGKLFMGPVWDFDEAAGNINYNGNNDPTGWWLRSNPFTYPQWTKRLFDDPAFAAAVAARWKVLKVKQFDTLPEYINTAASGLQQSQQNNFQRWPILGEFVTPNAEVAGSYQGEVNYLNSWLTQRIAWMDSQLDPPAGASQKAK
jgi:hypothetical protein